jgi:hypothetical protein
VSERSKELDSSSSSYSAAGVQIPPNAFFIFVSLRVLSLACLASLESRDATLGAFEGNEAVELYRPILTHS